MASYLDKNYKLERLDENYDLSSFFCGVEKLDECLHSDFFKQVKENNAYAFRAMLDEKLVAVFAIGEFYLELDQEDIDLVNMNLDESLRLEYSVRIPSMEIYYLAVNKDLQGRGFGEMVVDTIVELVEEQKPNIQFLSLDSLKTAIGFYEAVGFDKAEFDIPNKVTLRMYKVLNVEND